MYKISLVVVFGFFHVTNYTSELLLEPRPAVMVTFPRGSFTSGGRPIEVMSWVVHPECRPLTKEVNLSKVCTVELVEKERKKYLAELMTKPWGDIALRYIVRFERQAAEIYGSFGISDLRKKEAEAKLAFHREHPRKDEGCDEIALEQTRSFIRRDMGIDDALLNIIINPVMSKKKYGCCHGGNCLSISSRSYDWNAIPSDIIAHEVIHFLVRDGASHYLELSEKNRLILSKFQEERADIFGALCAMKALEAMLETYRPLSSDWLESLKYRDILAFNRLMRERSGGNDHPSHSERYRYLNRLYKLMYGSCVKPLHGYSGKRLSRQQRRTIHWLTCHLERELHEPQGAEGEDLDLFRSLQSLNSTVQK